MAGELEVARLLTTQQRLKAKPHAAKAKQLALRYLVEKFEIRRAYSARQVNATLQAWHTFGDHLRALSGVEGKDVRLSLTRRRGNSRYRSRKG